jgi:hypothetical protein
MKTRIAINSEHLVSVLAKIASEGLHVVSIEEKAGVGDTDKVVHHITTAVASEMDRDIEPFYRMAKACLVSSIVTLAGLAVVVVVS